MHVEDSYEGALRRLRRLEDAGFHQAPPSVLAQRDDDKARMQELEELATLACDENERLTGELAEARAESERLRAQVATLQMMLAGATPDDELALPRTRRGPAFYFFLLTLVGAAAAAAFVLRPWERLMTPAHVIVPDATPTPSPVVTPPPVVTAPAVTAPTTVSTPSTTAAAAAPIAAPKPTTAPVVTAPKPATTSIPSVNAIPKAAPVAPVVGKTHGRHHHAAKHHASKRAHHAASSATKKQAIGDTDDPLGGTSL